MRVPEIALQLGVHRATVYRWLSHFRREGLRETVKYYHWCKKKHRRTKRTDVLIQRKVFAIRERYHDCCGEKVRWYLQHEYGISLSVATIYRILHTRKVFRKRRNHKPYGQVVRGSKPREVIQADTVDFGGLFAFTYIDTYTREAFVDIQPAITAKAGADSLHKAGRYFRQIVTLQTDGGNEFAAEFRTLLPQYARYYRQSRPYKKNEQSFIESFNRTLRKECLGWEKYRKRDLEDIRQKTVNFLYFYNHQRPHLSLGLKPPKPLSHFS